MTAPLSSPPLKPAADQPCPCGSGQLFAACCEPVLSGKKPAATAEQLMRARFTAHTVHDFRFLHRTCQETADRPYVEEPAPPITWTRLVVHAHESGPRPDVATVDFSAFYTDQGREGVLQEKSEFQRIKGEWSYTRTIRLGPAPFKAAPKAGRNDPCPCGSGKKHKHCCL